MTKARDLANLGSNTAALATDSEVTSAVTAGVADKIGGDGSITSIVEVTQAEYDALTPDANTLYVIIG